MQLSISAWLCLVAVLTTAQPNLISDKLQAVSSKSSTDIANKRCFTGISAYNLDNQSTAPYLQGRQDNQATALVLPQISTWLQLLNWPAAYQQWLASMQCASPLRALFADGVYPKCVDFSQGQQICHDKQTSLELFTLHRHLLDSARARWNGLGEQFEAWHKFPLESEDYPEFLARQFRPWPDEITRNAKLADGVMMMEHAELIERWPSEADFVHWLHCGSGELLLSEDSLFFALLSNIVSASQTKGQVLNQYLFWRGIAWLDQAWNRYRMRIGLSPYEPEFQAGIIEQCLSLESAAQEPQQIGARATNTETASLYKDDYLNPKLVGAQRRIMAEVIALKVYPDGTQFIEVDVQRIGVDTITVSSFAPLDEKEIRLGRRLEFVGSVQLSSALQKRYRDRIHGPTFFIADAFFAVK